jgi:hypothetical protein
MSDVNLACTFLLAVLLAGALRAFLAARISIFYLSLFAVSVMSAPLVLEQIGVLIPDAVLVLLGMLLLISGTLLRISGSSGHSFRCEPASHFGIVRPPISV